MLDASPAKCIYNGVECTSLCVRSIEANRSTVFFCNFDNLRCGYFELLTSRDIGLPCWGRRRASSVLRRCWTRRGADRLVERFELLVSVWLGAPFSTQLLQTSTPQHTTPPRSVAKQAVRESRSPAIIPDDADSQFCICDAFLQGVAEKNRTKFNAPELCIRKSQSHVVFTTRFRN